MPSQICHALVARMALDASGIEFPTLVAPAFNLGCQGPDIFSHNRRTKPFAIAYSRMLHRGGYGRFCGNLARLIRNSPHSDNHDVVSWFLGFVTHQEADRALHPYIINRTHRSGPTGIPDVSPALMHAFFERILDACLLEAIERRSVSSFDTGDSFALREAECRPIAEIIAKALAETYDEAPLEDELELRVMNAFSDAIFFYAITNPARTALARSAGRDEIAAYDERGASAVALLYPTSVQGVDWLNEAHLPWKDPVDGRARTESAVDLFYRAVERAGKIVGLAYRAITLSDALSDSDELARAIGDSCLSIAGPDGKIAPVVASEPFDLEFALKREVALRDAWLTGEAESDGALS
jgi:hypothetical protein